MNPKSGKRPGQKVPHFVAYPGCEGKGNKQVAQENVRLDAWLQRSTPS
jgi:hypothetical protein